MALLTIILVLCLLDFSSKSFEGVDEVEQIHQVYLFEILILFCLEFRRQYFIIGTSYSRRN